MDYLAFLRQYRLGPFPLFDTALAYAGVFLVAPLLTKLFKKIHLNISWTEWLWLTLPISVLFHLIFRQDTPLMRLLSDPYHVYFYIIVFVLIFMTYMGLRNCKKPLK